MYSGKDFMEDFAETLRKAKNLIEKDYQDFVNAPPSVLDLIDEMEDRLDDYDMIKDEFLDVVMQYEVSEEDKQKSLSQIDANLVSFTAENALIVGSYLQKVKPDLQIEVWETETDREIGEGMVHDVSDYDYDRPETFYSYIEKLEKAGLYDAEENGCYELQFTDEEGEIYPIILSEAGGIYFIRDTGDLIEMELAERESKQGERNKE